MSGRGDGPLERVERLLEAMRALVKPGSESRRGLCERLVRTTALSPGGVTWAIDHCLELTPSSEELASLVASVPTSGRAHVILPANVFVAPHRALALALAAAPRVFVKASRREPALLEALAEQAPGLFERVSALQVSPGDQVWAYGNDTTLDALRRDLPAGTVLHAFGSGFGVVVVDLDGAGGGNPEELGRVAGAIAEDTACFDQRGCLSPRLVLTLGGAERTFAFAELLARALDLVEARLPRGLLDPSELADARWYRECAACFGVLLEAGQGAVSVALAPPGGAESGSFALDIPPMGRHLEVVGLTRLEPALAGLERWLTAVGCSHPALERRVQELLPRARVSPVGAMQRPAFDGPVDRRSDPAGELVEQRREPAPRPG